MSNYIPFVLIPFMAWGVWRLLKKRNDLTPLKRCTFYLGHIAFFLTEMGRSFYRPYIYSHGIKDYFVADTIGNSLGTVTAVFMILTLVGSGSPKDWRLIAMIIGGLIGYECLNLVGDHAFDPRDVAATLVFGALSAAVYARLLKQYGHAVS